MVGRDINRTAADLQIAGIDIVVTFAAGTPASSLGRALLVSYLDALGRLVVYLVAGSGHPQHPARNITVVQLVVLPVVIVVTGPEALAAVRAVGDGHRAAGHTEIIVGLDARLICCFGVDIQAASVHQDIFVDLDAVARAAASGNGNRRPFAKGDMVVAGDAALLFGIDGIDG